MVDDSCGSGTVSQACLASVAVSTVGLWEKFAGEPAPVRSEFAMLLHHLQPSKARSKPVLHTRVLLARHAETSAPDRFHGAESDIGLSELGAGQAQRLAAFFSRTGV